MSRIKALAGLAILACALLASAVPALAEFQSLPSKSTLTTGKFRVLNSGLIINKIGGQEIQVKCPIAGIKGIWEIRSTGKSSERIKGPGQQTVKRGPHFDINVQNWGETMGCEAAPIGITVVALVEPCIIQVHQAAGVLTNLKADVVTECRVKVLGCEIKYPAASEATTKNFQLGNIKLVNASANLNVLANITGMTTNQTKLSGSCFFAAGAGVGEIREFEIEAETVNAV